MKYKIQAIRTSDVQNVAICYEKLGQTCVQTLREVNMNSNFTNCG